MIRGSGPGGSKSRLAEAAGAESCLQRRIEKLHAAVAKHIFKSKYSKTCAKKRRVIIQTSFGVSIFFRRLLNFLRKAFAQFTNVTNVCIDSVCKGAERRTKSLASVQNLLLRNHMPPLTL